MILAIFSDISVKRHPFEDEISYLLENPPVLPKFCISNEFTDLNAPYTWVSTEGHLKALAEILKKEHAFSVDTEQHSVRSYYGFTALMQVKKIISASFTSIGSLERIKSCIYIPSDIYSGA